MSPPHDWLKDFGPGSEPSEERDPADAIVAAEPNVGTEAEDAEKLASAGETDVEQADAGSNGEQAEASGDGEPRDEPGKSAEPGESAGASQSAEVGQSAEAGQQADITPVVPGRSGWSGRAVGPLSGLLPGGAVELGADELPAAPEASQVTAEAIQPASAARPAAQVGEDEAVEDAEGPEPSLSATDDRWHAILVGFVDDPRGSVEAARALIDVDIAAHIALLARRKEAMHAAWQTSKDADTEALRVTLVNYRDLRKRLADVLNSLSA